MNATPVQSAVKAIGLRKSFGDKVVLDHLDLDIAEGTIFSLLGPNGAGKTTTLLMLLGAVTPDAGTISIDGFKLPRQRSKAMTKVSSPGHSSITWRRARRR